MVDAVRLILLEAREQGFLGPGPIEDHIAHARGFVRAAEVAGSVEPGGPPPERLLDLGSGGGVPGLVLADLWVESQVTLLDGSSRRAEFLAAAVRRCGLADRVVVDGRRAEVAGHDPSQRGAYELVTARSFGIPAATAECAAPFLRSRGTLVVSEPPHQADAGNRWPPEGLALLGLGDGMAVRDRFGYQVLRLTGSCPSRYPRRVGVPERRPLF